MPKTESYVQMKLDEAPLPVPVLLISPNPYQPESRVRPANEVILKMVASIMRHGLLQLPVVRLKKDEDTLQHSYEMGDGWLRLCAYRYLADERKLKSYNAIPVIIRELNDRQMADLVMEANTVRHDLNPVELAQFYRKYLDEFKVTQAELAEKHNCSQGEIANTLRLLDLPEEIRQQIITQEITETHGRALLQLRDEKAQKKLAEKAIKNKLSVAELDEEVKRHLWDNSLKLYTEQYASGNPLFDLAGCEKCEHRQLINDLYKQKPKPHCLNKWCWQEKQEKASAEAHEAEIAKLKEQGITRFFPDSKAVAFYISLDDVRLRRLDKPEECQSCSRRGAIAGYQGQYGIYCIDKECFEKKSAAKKQADEQSQRLEQEKTGKYIQDIFANLDTGSRETMLVTIKCLLYSSMDPRPVFNFVRAFSFLKIQDEAEDEEEEDPIPGIIAAIKEKADAKTLAAMLPRLAFELVRDGSDRELTDQLLNAFKACRAQPAAAQSEPEKKPGQKSDNDLLSTLEIKTPADEGEPYHLSLNGQTVLAETLKFGVVKLFQMLGVIPAGTQGVEYDLIKILKGYPASQNRDLLIGILEGKKTVEVKK